MIDKGITFFFGYDIEIDKRAKMIKDAGFTSVITCADKKFNSQSNKISKQVKVIRKYGLKLSSLHMRYDSKELPFLWENGKLGEKVKRKLIKDIKIAKKYGFTCVVTHLVGKYSLVGERRIKEILRYCEKVKIPLAVENLNVNKELIFKTFENVNSEMLKFCYDSGHQNVWNKEVDFLSCFGYKLGALHLHDNDGKKDEHTLTMCGGTINWDSVAKRLAKCSEVSLDYELFVRRDYEMSAEQFLKEVFKQANNLECLIESYRTN